MAKPATKRKVAPHKGAQRKEPTRKYQPDTKEGTAHFSVTLPKSLVKKIGVRAKANGVSRSYTVLQSLLRDFD